MERTKLPVAGEMLATLPVCAVQTVNWGPQVDFTQFHFGIDADTVAIWACIQEFGAALLGAEAYANMQDFNATVERNTSTWLRATAGA